MDGEVVSARNEVRPQYASVIRPIYEGRTGPQTLVPQSRNDGRPPPAPQKPSPPRAGAMWMPRLAARDVARRRRSSIEGAASECPPDLSRLYVGLEAIEDLSSRRLDGA